MNTRFRLFDGLRAVAALLVFTDHVWFQFHRSACGFAACSATSGFIPEAWTAIASGLGSTGVSIFYVISAFLLYRPFVASRLEGTALPLPGYAIRRLLRIFPAYWLVLGVVLIVGVGTRELSGGLLLQLATLTQVYTLKGLLYNPNPPTWTISVELSFYVFLGLWAYVMGRLPNGRRSFRSELLLLGGMALLAGVWRLYVVTHPALPGGYRHLLGLVPVSEKLLLGSLDLFAGGMLLAILSAYGMTDRISRWGAGRLWLGAASLYALLTWLTAVEGPLAGHWEAQELVSAWFRVPIALMVVLPAVTDDGVGDLSWRDPVRRFLGSAPLLWLGLVSYGIYLWHAPVLKWAAEVLGPGSNLEFLVFAGVAIGSLVATVLIAAASWYALEAPLNRLAHRITARERATAQVP